MLYRFRYPRTRPWDKYLKSLTKFLEKNEETAHLVAYLNKCQEHRSKLVKLLDECTRDGRTDAAAFIKILEEYIPALEELVEGLEANHVMLKGQIEIVWTSSLATNINVKSQSYQMQWEKIMAYIVLGICEYQMAVETHHANRAQAADMAKEKKEEKKADDDYDAIYGDAKPIEDPTILDDKELVKKISQHLKKASGIWNWVSTLYPVDVFNPQGKNNLNIPETYRDVLTTLSTIASSNAQEFMVQLAVQTNKSYVLTSKLASGVGDQLILADKRLSGNLGQLGYQQIKMDLRLYLKLRGLLYSAIGCKYHGKQIQKIANVDTDKLMECLNYFDKAQKILTSGFKNDKTGEIKIPGAIVQAREAVKSLAKIAKNNPYEKPSLNTVRVIEQSIIKQSQAVKVLYDAQADENKNVYVCFIKAKDSDLLQLPKVESKVVIKPDKFDGWKE